MLLPSLATLCLAVLLVFTIFFTGLDWQWVAFLSGILCAAVLSLVSASWKAQWRVARRTAQLAQFKERLAVETEQHRRTTERLDRELVLHLQNRERLAKATEALRLAEERLSVAEGALRTLERQAAAASPAQAFDAGANHDDAVREPATGLLVTDGSGHALYLRSLTEELTGWSDPRSRIREAIDQDRFELHAQDIVALRPGLRPARMLELLIRLRDEEENRLLPGAFLPAAIHFGLMTDIDRWVVKKILAACAAVDIAARAELPLLCINLARSSLEDRLFPEFVARALEQRRVPGQLLCFEIADTDVIAALADASRFAGDMKRLGCKLSLDGFGSAGVGFDHVKRLPLDFLKIDGRIVLAIARDPVAAAKVRAIQHVCRLTGVRTIAEMVESDEVLQMLRSLETDYAQGFGIARPHPLEALA